MFSGGTRLMGIALRPWPFLAPFIIALVLAAVHAPPAIAQRGLLDDVPEEKGVREITPKGGPERREVPDVRRDVPDVRKEVPKAPPEQMKVPTDLAALNGCWQSESGEIPAVNLDTNERIGTTRKCHCFRRDGNGQVIVVYTSLKNVNLAKRPTSCRGTLGAAIRGERLTIQHNTLSCTHGGTFNNRGTTIWICAADTTGTATCELQQPYGPRSEKFVRIDAALCGWRSR